MRFRRYIAAAALALLAILPAKADDFSAWSYYVDIEIDATKVDEAIPVIPVFFSPADATFWSAVKAGGADIRFALTDGTTALKYHLFSTFTDSGTTGTACALVNVSPIISATTNEYIRCFVGNSAATDASDSASVFSGTGYVGWWAPGIAVTNFANPGSYTLTAVGTPGTAASGIESITAAVYNGSSQYHYNGAFTAVSNWPLTMEGFFYPTDETVTGTAFGIGDDNSTSTNVLVAFYGATANDPIGTQLRGDSGTTSVAQGTTNYAANTTYYVVGNRDANTGTTRNYVGGAADGTDTTTVVAPDIHTISTGAWYRNGSAASYFKGRVAIAAVSSSVRSANFISTTNNAWTDAGFLTWGSTQSNGGGGLNMAVFQIIEGS